MIDHPITPPPELVQQWAQIQAAEQAVADHWHHIATRAAQWGADQELEACCGLLLQQGFDLVDYLRATRRPNPPSLKEQALDELRISFDRGYLKKEAADTIRRALEQLDD